MEEIDRFRGRPRRELVERLRAPLPCVAPFIKSRAAIVVLSRLWRAVEDAPVPPSAAREAAFVAAAELLQARQATTSAASGSRAAAMTRAAKMLGVSHHDEVEQALFADLPGERIVKAPDQIPSVADAALRVNLTIARSLLSRSSLVRIRCEGSVRPVVRQAHLRGLICNVEAAEPPELDLSGPFSLFRRTLLYGRALGELLPFLARTARFELTARCFLEGQEGQFTLRSGDPIFPAAEPKGFDSKVEERFAKAFKRAAPDWDLLREPEAVRADASLIFPDFLLRHRLDPRREYLLEIVGFWTPDYLARKLAALRAARIENLILAIDEERRCADGDLPSGARVIWYRRKIVPEQVLDLIR
jgi:predicted nuclease of restriction endonuclease-like RecB superfamily